MDIRFFQATATAIPTVAIAFAVSGKYLLPETYKDWPNRARQIITPALWVLALLFCALALNAERTSLTALAENAPTQDRWFSVVSNLGAIALIFVIMILAPALLPLFSTLGSIVKDAQKRRSIVGWVLASAFAALIFGEIIFTLWRGFFSPV